MEGSACLAASPALSRIEQAADRHQLRVSVISVWEVARLEAKARLRFAIPCGEWIRKALNAPGIALESSRLPGASHGDPADRILAATARQLGATLVTADKRLLDYGKSGFLSVLSLA